MGKPNKVLILFSDTGGGHRASGEALVEALKLEYGDDVETDMVDVFAGYTPYPFSRFPRWYPLMVSERTKWLWGRGYRLSNTPRRSEALSTTLYPYVRPSFRRMLRTHPADVIVVVHGLMVTPILRALGRSRPPVVTVVTDLVSVHAFWFHTAVDFTITPTEAARQFAVEEQHLHPTRVKTIGLPVHQRFTQFRADKVSLRDELGWQHDLKTVLLLSGGDGIGPLGEIAMGLAKTGLPIQLAVVCGRNEKLYKTLKAREWEHPTHIYGFVRNMPDLMRAADLLVTKAGPSSVMEGLNCGLPLVLSSAIPGQEDGNVSYVVDNNAGIWAPTPEKVITAVSDLLAADPAQLQTMTENARALARPEAAREIAREIGRFFFVPSPPRHEATASAADEG